MQTKQETSKLLLAYHYLPVLSLPGHQAIWAITITTPPHPQSYQLPVLPILRVPDARIGAVQLTFATKAVMKISATTVKVRVLCPAVAKVLRDLLWLGGTRVVGDPVAVVVSV